MNGSTQLLAEASRRTWPVVVVGAGIAGSVAAFLLAQQGVEVLLVEKQHHPRPKTCGGCLHPAGFEALRAIGLGELDALRAAPRLTRAVLRRVGGPAVTIPFTAASPFRAIDRSLLDASLTERAIEAGATYLGECHITESSVDGDSRCLLARCGAERHTLRAGIVIACDGLNGPLAKGAGLVHEPRAWWRRKAGFSLDARGSTSLDPEAITMLCEEWGYLGAVRMGGGEAEHRWHLAAAVFPAVLRQAGGPLGLAKQALERHGVGPLELMADTVTTAPTLSRSLLRPWHDRLLVAGDASGYVEPITGEGMTWAIAAARAAAESSLAGWSANTGPGYERAWKQRVESGRGLVRLSAFTLDWPSARRAAWWALSASRPLRRWIGRRAVTGASA